jgi:AcrR family transcriptional regulator
MVPKTKNSQKKYDQILKTATRLFNESGITISGVDLISAESGVAKMTLYKYFQSKDGLIKKYLELIAQNTLTKFNDECAKGDAHTCISRFFDNAISDAQKAESRACPLVCASLEVGKENSEFQDVVRGTFEQIRHSFDMKLYEFKHPNARDASFSIMNLYQGSITMSFTQGSIEPLEQAKNQALGLLS